MLQKSSKRLTGMVDDFLTAMKIESGEMFRDMQCAECDINPHQIGEQLTALYHEVIDQRQLSVENQLPDTTVTLFVYGPHVLEILKRLFDNAVKFSADNSRIAMVMSESEKTVTLSIRDEGEGIPKEKHEELYSKFGQIDREKNEQQGSGLGLFIANSLAAANNAKLWFNSDAGKGATFFIELPRFAPH